MKFINQMEPSFDENEINHLVSYMQSAGWLTEFKETREFERLIAEYVGAQYCSVVNNGTVSLFIALVACGVGKNDEVIVPDYTMIATANAVVLAGATPVFVDINRADLCLDLELVKKAVTSRTKALMLVTINGRYPDRIDDFIHFCRKKDIVLIEDAAQSLGSRINGKHLGTFGEIGSFSFSAPKIITTGQGGALVTDNKDLYEKMLKIKDFGRIKSGVDYHETIGYNFKFTELQAVIGIEQIKKLETRVKRKREIFALYKESLKGIPEVAFIETNLQDTAPWFIDILVPEPLDLGEFLKANGIGSRPFYPPIHSQPAYGFPGHYPEAEYASKHGLWLPSSSSLGDEQIGYICDKIKKYYE